MPNILTYARLAADVYNDGSGVVDGFHRAVHLRPRGQIVAAAYTASPFLPVVIAFRGSVTRGDWGKADVDIAQHFYPTAYVGEAFEFFSRVVNSGIHGMKDRSRPIVLVGHSLGGALAAVVGARITTRKVAAVTFNAPPIGHWRNVGSYHDLEGDDTVVGSAIGKDLPAIDSLAKGYVLARLSASIQPVARASLSAQVMKPNARSAWHVRLSVRDGHQVWNDTVSSGAGLVGTDVQIWITRQALTQKIEKAAQVPILGKVGAALPLFEAHLMPNVIAALRLPENSKWAATRPNNW